ELAQFRRDFSSRLWLTYRSGFPALPGSPRTTDCGWGCTLRSAQMLLGQGLVLHLLGRDPQTLVEAPRIPGGPPNSGEDPKPQRRDPKPLQDPQNPGGLPQSPPPDTPRSAGKRAGDWSGPAIAAHILRGAVESCPETPGLAVYVAQDCTAPGSGTPGSGQRRGVVLLVPVRLGGESLNPVYVECVKELLQLSSCLGIVGGKPRHSLYFLGFQGTDPAGGGSEGSPRGSPTPLCPSKGDSLLYLDPHYCQPCVDPARENFSLQSFHCRFPRKMPFGKMDPSCTFGFYATRTELEELWGDLARVLAPPLAPERYPIFSLLEGLAQDQALDP
ncbi:ATG4D protease, partial [Cephalopterus ornatus]|nr:ATG4D protease [Cephalopterus ornatus]